MAANMTDYLQKNPDYSMAVLAGNGHIMHGYGIPSRAQRRGVNEYKIVLNMSNPEPGIADYLLYPSNIDTQKAKKLGVFFKSDEDLNIEKLVEHSAAQKAQIKAGDRVIAFDGVEVKNIYDIKTELTFAKNSCVLTMERDGKKIDLNIEFQQ
jgi:S1-C subfamily serine protease